MAIVAFVTMVMVFCDAEPMGEILIADISGNELGTLLDENRGPVLVDFWAPWCGPCKMLDAPLRKLDQLYGDKLKIVKIDISKKDAIVERLSVRATPTFIIFDGGFEKDRRTGGIPAASLTAWIETLLATRADAQVAGAGNRELGRP